MSGVQSLLGTTDLEHYYRHAMRAIVDSHSDKIDRIDELMARHDVRFGDDDDDVSINIDDHDALAAIDSLARQFAGDNDEEEPSERSLSQQHLGGNDEAISALNALAGQFGDENAGCDNDESSYDDMEDDEDRPSQLLTQETPMSIESDYVNIPKLGGNDDSIVDFNQLSQRSQSNFNEAAMSIEINLEKLINFT